MLDLILTELPKCTPAGSQAPFKGSGVSAEIADSEATGWRRSVRRPIFYAQIDPAGLLAEGPRVDTCWQLQGREGRPLRT